MTGRELILYILQNGLEDSPVFKDGKLIGHLTVSEAAAKCGFGTATVRTWVVNKMIDYVKIGDVIFIPYNFEPPVKKHK
jgi:hypothetical protein